MVITPLPANKIISRLGVKRLNYIKLYLKCILFSTLTNIFFSTIDWIERICLLYIKCKSVSMRIKNGLYYHNEKDFDKLCHTIHVLKN